MSPLMPSARSGTCLRRVRRGRQASRATAAASVGARAQAKGLPIGSSRLSGQCSGIAPGGAAERDACREWLRVGVKAHKVALYVLRETGAAILP